MHIGNHITTALVISFTFAASTQAATVFATSAAGSLLRFDSNSPGGVVSVALSGLQTDESLLGIDFRPADRMLYGIGSTGRLYTINYSTGAVSQVGTPGQFDLDGISFGFDFNPVPDRIRLTSDSDQNLRLNPNNAALAATDITLAFGAGDVNAGENPNIVGSAYTNSFAGATATTLYGIDSSLGILVTQAPPNNGTLNTVGSLGVSTTGTVGFDILFPGNLAFASLQAPGGFSSLYSIDLTTGRAALIDGIGTNQVVTGLAVSDIPEPGTTTLVGCGLLAAIFAYRRRTRQTA